MIWTPAYRVFTDQVSRPAFGWTLLAVLMALALAVAGKLVADRLGIPDTELFRDPAAEFDIPSYAGLFSYLGISSLFATAAVAGATAIVVPTVRSICVSVSALSVFLALDDLLLIHEGLGPRFLGISENVFFLGYAILGCALFVILLRTERRQIPGLMLVGSLLAASILLDKVEWAPSFDNNLSEDTLKFMGLCGWFAFWSHFCVTTLQRRAYSPERAR